MWWKLLGTVAVVVAEVFATWAGKKAAKKISESDSTTTPVTVVVQPPVSNDPL